MANILTKRREPFQFMLMLGMVGSGLIFLLLTFTYLLRKSGADWSSFALPKVFWVSTVIILLSSFTLHGANWFFYRERFMQYKWLMGVTLALGTLFIILQYLGWMQLHQHNVRLSNNIAGAFIYVISGVHLLHIAGGLIFLLSAFLKAIRRTTYVDAFVYSVNPPNQLKLRLVTLYWHFVDVLWVCLFLFFLYHHK